MLKGRHSRLKRYFNVYDTDQNGSISREDFDLQARRRAEALHARRPGGNLARRFFRSDDCVQFDKPVYYDQVESTDIGQRGASVDIESRYDVVVVGLGGG